MSDLVLVRITGPLAEKYGAEHRFAIATPREAVHALCANYPGFRRDFLDAREWAVLSDGDWLPPGDMSATSPVSREVTLCPVIEGEAFLGAVLVAAIIPSLAGTAAATILGGLLVTGLLLGASLLLTPKPKKPDGAADGKKDDSYAFSGPENITTQGGPVPVAYGSPFVGSVVVSAGLEVAEELLSNGVGSGVTIPGGAPLVVMIDIGGGITVPGPQGWTYVSTATTPASGTVYIFRSPDGQYYWNRVAGFYTSKGTLK